MYQKRGMTGGWDSGKWVLSMGLGVLLGAIVVSAATVARGATSVPENAAAFELKEVSVFEAPEGVRQRFSYGVVSRCQSEPDGEVRQYPPFKSDKPLYGSFQVGGGEEPEAGYRYAFAIDESGGAGKGYDRMYIDTNLNGDLTDDSPGLPVNDVPDSAKIRSSAVTAEVFFQPVGLRVMPEDRPDRRLEVMPRFFAYGTQRSYATLLPTKLHVGTIQIGDTKLDAVLGHSGAIPGWFDHPDTNLYLQPAGKPSDPPIEGWYAGTQLKAWHRNAETYYRLSATPSGDKLFVQPYQGPMGVLEIKAGSRDVQTLSVTGTLASQDATVSLTEGLGGETSPTAGSCKLPVGDYGPMLLNIKYDTLQCLILRNRHAEGLPGGRSEMGPPIYGIKIRQDKPFALDLSGEPKVVFALPAKGDRVPLGGQLSVKAVLTDPALDIMFRQIRDKDQLNPTVKIARANGEIVAEGVMPFG